ncbi:Sterile alpha motif domain-containing protein 5 [Bulinus truncatus]|nr:Sterile alpha motif domain-containing protein 5 [Bulinus truncatus]
MASGSNSIVEDWLRSVDLVQYTQSFLDNGYDDLEVCKQIGEDDLDAIGVPKDEHREKLMRAVKVLREEGGAAVYFTLEECDTCQSGDETEVGEGHDDDPCPSSVCGVVVSGHVKQGGGAVRLDAYDMGKTTLVTYPKVQLKLILRDKLVEDNIDLAGPPFTTSNTLVSPSGPCVYVTRFGDVLTILVFVVSSLQYTSWSETNCV